MVTLLAVNASIHRPCIDVAGFSFSLIPGYISRLLLSAEHEQRSVNISQASSCSLSSAPNSQLASRNSSWQRRRRRSRGRAVHTDRHTYMALLPLFLRPVVRFAACVAVAGGPAAAAATILHRAGALPRNRGLERLVRDGHGWGRSGIIASLVVGVMRCLC